MKKLALPLFIAVFGAAALQAQSLSEPNVKLVIRSGLVEVQRGNIWFPMTLGDVLRTGEHVRTANGSTAALQIGPESVVTLNEQSVVTIGQRASDGSAVVELERGSMKVFAPSDILVAAKDTMLESAERPLDLELGFQADKVNLTIFNGAVRNGSMIIRGGNQDPTMRTYVANGRSSREGENVLVNPTYYVYPYFLYGNPDPNAGRIVPPVVNNPTNPGFRPTQVVPPMSDPIRVPVTKP